ncbi:histidine kinase [Bacillus thuringiensis]|uniref:Histidine kinase n=3 Tax=Bacillus cereus group TaxID=86661 RepID=A0A9Q1W3X6_BACTU|nr:histidine kinase [Bacillus thuringiensis serovar morrisoni]AMR84905.1 histidine kinase [Bacillus thuringiensis]AND07972.1 histidine kinase [Bacillus thuringiensis serovar alesti]AND24293.1 histidine kinase [Bacillus thuringiensis serovar israelensis]AXR16870.1 histidine kinase [Bacillus sp. CR71]AXR22809.1 histidine kinase [Bacillus sp. E25]AZV66357.1 histidine kinase [Bacillus cereus]EAO53114.1 Sensor protein vanS [Bacillus thuringiensis serovar israelensis ATCC 35646]KAA0782282.1 histi
MGKFVDTKGISNNGKVNVQIINYGNIIPEDLPYLFNILHIKNYNITYNKKRQTLDVGESTITNK